MHPFFHSRFVRFTGIGILILIVILVVIGTINLLTSSSGLSGYQDSVGGGGYTTSNSVGESLGDWFADRSVSEADMTSSYMPAPAPTGYTDTLESYETSHYSVSARTKQFDALCQTVASLKSDPNIHFKHFTSSLNRCRSTFYVTEERVAGVLTTLNSYQGIEITQTTESVTRHRENIQSQTSILRQQLASVERSLNIAETEFDQIAIFAREQNDPSTLSGAIREKLNLIDTLTQRKINITSQLDSLLQQAADLEARMNVVEFSVNINRSYPLTPNDDARKWEYAWEELSDTFTNTLIGLTAFFGIFLLWTVRIVVYLLVAIVILRGLWKFVRYLWKKW